MTGNKQQRSVVQRWLMVLAVVAILGGGYYWFLNQPADFDNFGATAQEENRVPGQQNILLLRELRRIDLSNNLFQSQVFQSLFDTTIEVGTEPIGRPNPFAPVGQN